MALGGKMGVVGKGQKTGIFRLSQDKPAKHHCKQIEHLALNMQVQTQ